MNEILSLNLKKFRVSQKLTQEQAAEALDVSAQTISRWECGNTLPEATKLPEIARLYSVTIDDLFKQHAVAYQNYAQRLAAVYESSHRSEDFISAEREFHSLIDSGNYTPDDMRLLGVTYQFMMTSCAENALYWFDRVLREEDAAGPELCHRTRLQKMRLLAQLGKGDEAVEQQLAAVHDHPHSAENRALLVAAYVYANRYEEAFACTAEALSEFPEEWELYVHAGDICMHLEQYGEALAYAGQALQLCPDRVDAKYTMAQCYEKMGEAEKAADVYLEIAADLKQRGAEVESGAETERARSIREKNAF